MTFAMNSNASASAFAMVQYGANATSSTSEKIAAAMDNSDAARVHETAKQFESVFLAQMLKPMFDTVEVDENFGGGSAEETWRGILIEKYAERIADAGGVGIAECVEKQMLKLQEIADGHKAQTAADSAASTEESRAEATERAQSPASASTAAERGETFAARSTSGVGFGYARPPGGGAVYETTQSFLV